MVVAVVAYQAEMVENSFLDYSAIETRDKDFRDMNTN